MRHRSARATTQQAERRRRLALLHGPLRCQAPGCTEAAVDWHEVKSRARGGSPTDPDNGVMLCRHHHDEVTAEAPWAYETDPPLLRHSWDAGVFNQVRGSGEVSYATPDGGVVSYAMSPRPPSDLKSVTVKLSATVLEAVDGLALRSHMDRSAVIRWIIDQHMAQPCRAPEAVPTKRTRPPAGSVDLMANLKESLSHRSEHDFPGDSMRCAKCGAKLGDAGRRACES